MYALNHQHDEVFELMLRWYADGQILNKQSDVPDTIEMTQKPHHADDVKAYMGKETPLFLRAIKVPTRQMHLHILDVRFSGKAPDPDVIHKLFASELGVSTRIPKD